MGNLSFLLGEAASQILRGIALIIIGVAHYHE